MTFRFHRILASKEREAKRKGSANAEMGNAEAKGDIRQAVLGLNANSKADNLTSTGGSITQIAISSDVTSQSLLTSVERIMNRTSSPEVTSSRPL